MVKLYHRSRVSRNSFGFLFTGAIRHLYMLSTIPILTCWLAPDEWGLFTILVQVNTILQFATLSLFSQSFLKFYAEYDVEERKCFIGTTFLAVTLFQGVFVLCLYFSRYSILPILYPNIILLLVQLQMSCEHQYPYLSKLTNFPSLARHFYSKPELIFRITSSLPVSEGLALISEISSYIKPAEVFSLHIRKWIMPGCTLKNSVTEVISAFLGEESPENIDNGKQKQILAGQL